MKEEVVKFFNVVGLEINRTNSELCVDVAEKLSSTHSYKYLGITADRMSFQTRECYNKIEKLILARTENLFKSKLNAKNLIGAVNEHGTSLMNYYVGLLKLEPSSLLNIDHSVRQVLNKYGIHLQPACPQRLYLPREELCRGLKSVENRREMMLLQLYTSQYI